MVGGDNTKSRIIKDFKTILGYRWGGGAAVLQLSREDKICAILFLQGFLRGILFLGSMFFDNYLFLSIPPLEFL